MTAANTRACVRLTPWAPGCIDLAWSDPRLCRDYWSTPLPKVVASILRRLGAPPETITLAERSPGDIEFIGPVPPEHDPYGDRTGILALLWGGPSLDAVRAELERLITAGWKPGAWSPPRPTLAKGAGQVIDVSQTSKSTAPNEGVSA